MRKTTIFFLAFSLFACAAAKANPVESGYSGTSSTIFGGLIDGLTARFATGRCLRS